MGFGFILFFSRCATGMDRRPACSTEAAMDEGNQDLSILLKMLSWR